jgi:hypothetical protein
MLNFKPFIYSLIILLFSIQLQSCQEHDEYAHLFDNSKEFLLKESDIKVKLPEDFERISLDAILLDSTFIDYTKRAIKTFNPNYGIVETYWDKGSSGRVVCFIQDTTFYKAIQHNESYSPYDTMNIYFDTLQQLSGFELSKFHEMMENYKIWRYFFDVEMDSDSFYPTRFFQSNFMIPFKGRLITVIEFSDDNNHQEQRLDKYLESIWIYNE